jgi:phospholipase/carboxylesterase
MNYRKLETPQGVTLIPQTTAQASVVWLHGLGADGHDFVPLIPELRLPDALAVRFVFPHAPVRPVTINNGMPMRAWYDVIGFGPDRVEDERGIVASSEFVRDLAAREVASGIASTRVVLAGFSQGGAIALHAALRYPDPLAGVLALSTYLPCRGSLAAQASAANRHISILMCHGTYDPVLPIQLGTLARDTLSAAGYAVTWKVYPMQHQVCGPEVTDIANWLHDRLSAPPG